MNRFEISGRIGYSRQYGETRTIAIYPRRNERVQLIAFGPKAEELGAYAVGQLVTCSGFIRSRQGGQDLVVTQHLPYMPLARMQPTLDVAEAERQFFALYHPIVGGTTWSAVQALLATRAPSPTTIEGWLYAEECVRAEADRLRWAFSEAQLDHACEEGGSAYIAQLEAQLHEAQAALFADNTMQNAAYVSRLSRELATARERNA